MFSKIINHQKPSVFLLLVALIHLIIHSTNGECVVVMARHATIIKDFPNGNPYNEPVLLDDDKKEAKKLGRRLNALSFAFDVAFTSSNEAGFETLRLIRQEITQQKYCNDITTSLLNRYHQPESISQELIIKRKVAEFWNDPGKPQVAKEKDILIVATGPVLKEVAKIIEKKTDIQMEDFDVNKVQPFYYVFNENPDEVPQKYNLYNVVRR